MTAALQSIKTCYEELAMTPEQIADDQSLEVAAVKAGLMQCSSKYRKDIGAEEEGASQLDFTADEEQRINASMLELALGADNEAVRLNACKYIKDERRGRNDAVKKLANGNFNILQINQFMAKNREIANGVKRQAGIVDVS